MLLPYRTKNPPEHFPFATVTLIVLNVVIYLITSTDHAFFRVNDSALESFAVAHNNLGLYRLTTAMFLHANLEHIIGNMLFLWLFGAATEGRIRPLKFLIVYFLAGWTGGLLSDLVQGLSNPDRPSLGASGAIMGLAGAYLYLFPHSTICVLYGWSYRWGTAEWKAWCVVALYVGLDVLFGVLIKAADGVGHFAHLGGFGTGLLVVVLLRGRRDTEEASQARATLADTKDFSLLGFTELEAMMAHPTDNMELVLAYCEKAMDYSNMQGRQERGAAKLIEYAPRLLGHADPVRLARIALFLPPTAPTPPLVCYLRLGAQLESIGQYQVASQMYYQIYRVAPNAPENEMALYRTGQMASRIFNNGANAQAAYAELLRLFPNGQMALQARQALKQIGASGL